MWDWAIWGALIACAVLGVAAIVNLVVRSLQTWRDFKRTRRHLVRAIDRLTEQSEAVAERTERAADTREVTESLERLRRSLARLSVLVDAFDEAQGSLGRLAAVMPRR